MRIALISAAILVGCTACATTAPSPVTGEFRSNYSMDSIHVDLPDDQKIPDRYDVSINRLLESETGMSNRNVEGFYAYAEAQGGLTEDNSGELFLEFLVLTQLEAQLPGVYVGDRDSVLQIDINSTIFPNAATMLLVGEVIGTSYSFTMTDENSGDILVDSAEPLAPFVQRSAGAGGGMLGLALRGGGDRHLMDLQRIADAISHQVNSILMGHPISTGDVRRINVNALPIIPPSGASMDAGDVVSD